MNISERLRAIPWWVFVLVSLLVYAGLRLIPLYSPECFRKIPVMDHTGSPELVALFGLAPLALSLWITWIQSSRLARHDAIRCLNELDWVPYCDRLSSALSSMGYTILSQPRPGNDPFCLIKIIKQGTMTLALVVRHRLTGVNHLRGLLDLMVTEGIEQGLIISTGLFSGPARRFARRTPLTLMDGSDVVSFLNGSAPLGKPLVYEV